MARGYNAIADAITRTVDGKDINEIWDEFTALLNLLNTTRTGIASLFTFTTALAADDVVQGGSSGRFEVASEYGVPQSIRATPAPDRYGFPFKWYDAGTRFTWQFLNYASAAQIEAVHDQALAADNELTYNATLKALMAPTAGAVNKDGVAVRGLWDGTGSTPAPYAGQTFSSTHSHYLTSGTTTLDGGDLETLLTTIQHHGHGAPSGDRVIILANPVDAQVIRSFRSGVAGASNDFIPADDAPAFLTNQTIVGSRPAGQFQGLKVFGSYGDAWLTENYMVPAGYVLAVATAGANSPRNPLAFREDAKPALRGLLQIAGTKNTDYPLMDSYYLRGFGVGVRNRGAAAVMQITASATYTAPTIVVP